MASVSGTIPNLIGGISQQPSAARLPNTAGDLKNAFPSVVSGLRKRPPLRFVADIMAAPTTTVAKHILDRPTEGDRIVIAADNTIKVFQTDGTEETVDVTGSAISYVTESDPEANIGFLTIADTTFIYNRTKVTSVSAVAEDASRPSPGTLMSAVVENAAALTKFDIDINGTNEATWTDDAQADGVETVAHKLLTDLNNGGFGTKNWSATKYSHVLSIPSISTDTIAVSPSSLVRGYRDIVSKFSHLPPDEKDGRLLTISGNPDAPEAAYYVQYDADDRRWDETFGYNANEAIDVASMPHVLVDDGDGTWTVQPWVWPGRTVGDSDSNPTPSFIGYAIQSLYIQEGRLSVLADEQLVMSEVDYFENFYRTTCTELIDSDRIDVSAKTTDSRTAHLYNATDFQEGVLLFSDKAQFKVNGKGGISPNTLSIDHATGFNASPYVKPVTIGKNVGFIDDNDDNAWAAMREYFVDATVGVEDSEILTKQVPEFLPSGVRRMVSNPSADLVSIFTTGDRTKLFAYSYYWSSTERVQSAWHYWEADNVEFLTGDFINNRMYLVVKRDGRILLTYVDLQETILGDFEGIEVMLDMRIAETGATVVYDGSNTTVTMPYGTVSGELYTLVLTADGSDTAGTAYHASSISGNDVIFNDIDLSADTFLIGYAYSFEYELSPIYLRDSGGVPVQDGRLQLKYLSILYHQASYFRVETTPEGRSTFIDTFTGRTFGSITNIIGSVAVSDGEFRTPVSAEPTKVAIKIINDSPFNSRFSSIEWEGAWRPRTKRMRK